MGWRWSDMTVLQQIAWLCKVIAIMAIAANFAFTCYIVNKAYTDRWFVKCTTCATSDSKCLDGCCQDCTRKDEVYFYIFRVYTLFFCAVAVIAELKLGFFKKFFGVCDYYVPRGFWQIFIGFSTVASNTVRGSTPASALDGVGYTLVAIGVLHCILGLLCFKEYKHSDQPREKQMTSVPSIAPGAGPNAI